jgi:hypothetical protein
MLPAPEAGDFIELSLLYMCTEISEVPATSKFRVDFS